MAFGNDLMMDDIIDQMELGDDGQNDDEDDIDDVCSTPMGPTPMGPTPMGPASKPPMVGMPVNDDNLMEGGEGGNAHYNPLMEGGNGNNKAQKYNHKINIKPQNNNPLMMSMAPIKMNKNKKGKKIKSPKVKGAKSPKFIQY